ncbi:MAG: lysyl-tRNA synthetase [Candidatus Berkelbacteria bacterium]|nr:lysyl-tRNA synthetase [Candidatus Berkelbacteria bacterium]
MFWVDEIIEDILKKIPKDSYLITDWTTPSGHSHVGALRGVIVHDIIRQGLEAKNKKAGFQFGFDDFDPMDGLPIYVDKSWEKFMGIPLSRVPAPDGQSKSFSEQYLQEFTDVFNGLGITPQIVKTSELYKSGKFNKAISLVLDNAQEIRKIYKEVSGSDKGEDWFPLQVVCPKCGKIGTTKVTDWNGKEVRFKCQENLVKWAKGCGYEGSKSPFDGNAKLPWKVEWACKWFIFGTDIEGEGKDHSAAGGSRDIANAIYRKVFSAQGRSAAGGKKEPPYDIPYEFFLVGGKKMASSKGLGVTAKDMVDFLPANILRFLFVRTRAKRAIEFKPEGETIPLLYDEFDRNMELFYKDPKQDLARAYYYSVGSDKEQTLYQPRFSKIAYMLQMPRVDVFEYAKEEKGSELTEIEKKEIENRIEIAKKWLQNYAPENYKFTILDKMPAVDLSEKQKEFLAKILETFQSKEDWSGEDLHKKIHNVKNDLKINPRDAFASIYQIFIGKDSGPQAGWLLASLDREFVLLRLQEIEK